jgi:hypothetical protein
MDFRNGDLQAMAEDGIVGVVVAHDMLAGAVFI